MSKSITSRLQWRVLQLVRKLWFRATLFSVLAVVTALIALAVKPLIPAELPMQVGANAVDNILGVIASSMLAVTIFSLSTMVSAYVAASGNASPRAIRLLTADSTAQNALGTFIGAFLFSLVGIIALSTEIYGAQGRLVLFAVTIAMIAFVVFTLLRWIHHVSRLGQVATTTERVEKAFARAMRARQEHPYLGGQRLQEASSTIPTTAMPLYPSQIGYVQHVDIEALSELADQHPAAQVYVTSPPGSFAEPSRPLAWLQGITGTDAHDEARNAFSIDDLRSFDQDPRFGAAVLAEIASRALSPGVNDPGTAIDVIGRAIRVLAIWSEPPPASADELRYPRVHVPAIEVSELFDDIFRPIARDGAGVIEVGIRLQKALLALARLRDPRFGESALNHSQQALRRAERALDFDEDEQLLRTLAEQVAAQVADAAVTRAFTPPLSSTMSGGGGPAAH